MIPQQITIRGGIENMEFNDYPAFYTLRFSSKPQHKKNLGDKSQPSTNKNNGTTGGPIKGGI